MTLGRAQQAELEELRRRYDRLCAELTHGMPGDSARDRRLVDELQALSDRIVALAAEGPPAANGRAGAIADAPRSDDAPALAQLLAAIERQGAEIEQILRRCNEQLAQLERMERRFIETMPLIERQLPELREAIDRQRERITALAIAVQRLSQWLVLRAD